MKSEKRIYELSLNKKFLELIKKVRIFFKKEFTKTNSNNSFKDTIHNRLSNVLFRFEMGNF